MVTFYQLLWDGCVLSARRKNGRKTELVYSILHFPSVISAASEMAVSLCCCFLYLKLGNWLKNSRLNSKGHLDIFFELILANLCDMNLLAPLWCVSLTISKANNLLNCSFKISSCITKMLKKKKQFSNTDSLFFSFPLF